MKTNFFLGLIFAFLLHFNLNAQRALKGIVNDSIGEPVPYVNVVLKKDSKIISYATTSVNGYFKIDFENIENFEIVISGLGYNTISKSISVDNSDTAEIDLGVIVLLESLITLEEVELSANKPIIVKNDTISIKVESFLNGSEEVVEDILEKLPGVEVGKDGTIRVQGQSVEKVMVEGDDLFEKGYKLLTKNLNAGVIDKVEILEHYSENALLKNIENSDKIALNLTLKENRKTTLFGNVTASYGTDNFYEEKANLISFNKKTKYYFFGNLNNIGSDAIGDIYQIIYPDVFTSTTYVGDGTSGINLLNLYANTPDLDENRYNFNNAELASINGIYNPNENTKIKALLFFTSDERNFNSNRIEQFDLPPAGFTNTEDYKLRKNGSAISAKLDGLFNIGKNKQLEYVGRYSYGKFEESSALIFNQESIEEDLKSNSEFTDHRLTYTSKLNDYSALQITGRYIYDLRPQDYNVNSFVFQEVFPERDDIEEIRQNSTNKLGFAAIEGVYLMNKKRSNVTLKLGYTKTENSLNSQLTLIDGDGQIFQTGEDFNNTFNYDVGDIYLKSKYIYTLDKISVRPSLDFHQLFVNSTNNEVNPFIVIPGIGLSWEINKENKLFASYKYSSKNIPLSSIYDNFSLNGYRSLRRGTGDFQLLRGSFFLASYILGNWSDSFLINASLLYNLDEKYVSSNSLIRSNFTQSSSVILRDREFYSINLSVDNFLEKLSSNIKLKLGISKNAFQNIVNQSELRSVNNLAFNYGLEYKSVFLGSLNFHFGTNWENTIIETSVKNKNLNNTSFLDLNFKINEKFNFNLKNEQYYFGNISNKNTFWFTDFQAFYKIKKNKLNLTLQANNLLNTNSFTNFSINDTGFFKSDFELLPRYFLLKFEYRF